MLGKFFQRPGSKTQSDSTSQDTASAKTKIEIGAVVEQRYRLDAEIGCGGMGVVFRAHDLQLDRDVAFKVAYLGDGMGGTRAQFLHEARVTSQLVHPHIVAVYETGEVDTGAPQTSPFMVMELIRGGSLDGLRGLSFAQIIDLGRQVCDALAYAHDHGLVHRDLKPNNVLVEKHGYRYIAKLMDFGLARDLSELTTQAGIAGMVYYIAPEVIEGKPAEIAADLYALGAMLYEMVTGHVPFSDFDEQGILSQHLKESVVPPSDTRSDIPFALESIILRLLAKNPQDRFASAREVSDALAQVVPAPESIAALNNLPRLSTHFIGREKEIADLKQLIEANRAVALVGAGGVGKTRLALATAESLIGQFVDGIWLIDFAPWNDPSLVPQIVATALGVREQARCTLVVSLMEQLRSKEMLLVLDQCDRLDYACVQLAETILQACPAVRLILTSRLPLNLSSAVVYNVPSLNASDAEKLFCEHMPKLSDQDTPMFTQVCQQLGGIPLAIELVAARTSELSLTQVNEHLMRLEAENGAALWRDQATRAIVGWSYNLLSPQAQDLLNRLSVFIGGFTLAAVEAFSGIGTLDTEKLLNQLISASLVDMGASNTGETRYRLLEPVRQLAFGKLQEAGAEASISRSHRDGYFLLAMQAEPQLHGVEQGIWLKRLETEYANVIAALDLTIDHPADVTVTFRFGGALLQFWNERDYWSEGRRRLERIL